ncbi:hypothetical protein [Georgenia sp. Z1491]|uniref:hypothetical protein n=1 Tax=unclassified Georgenia TaxID=2626815 RepID=UPI003CF13408
MATASALAVGVRTARRSGWLRGSLVGAVAFDLVGGLVAFQLPATRERYSMKAMRSRLTFALVHVQPFALPLLGEGSWRRAGLRCSTAVASTVALERLAPRSPGRRLIANGVAAALSLVDLATDSSRQRWFGPVFTMKVVGGHGGIPAAPVGS